MTDLNSAEQISCTVCDYGLSPSGPGAVLCTPCQKTLAELPYGDGEVACCVSCGIWASAPGSDLCTPCEEEYSRLQAEALTYCVSCSYPHPQPTDDAGICDGCHEARLADREDCR